MPRVKVTLVRSVIDKTETQKRTVQALGLRKLHHSVEHELTPAMAGMIRAVSHLVKLEELA